MPAEAQQAEGARNQATTLARRLASYEDHLEQVTNSLLAVYREANRAARSTPAPAHFDQRWLLAPRTDPYFLLGEPELPKPETVDAALDEIRELHDVVLRRFEKLLAEAEEPAGQREVGR